jgi:hypothetical protein
MNSSILTADRATHVRIGVIALLAGLLVVWISTNARLTVSGNLDSPPDLQSTQSSPKPAGPPMRPLPKGKTAVA